VPLTHRHQIEFRAGQEHEERQTEVRERGDDRVRVRQPEHRGPEHDAEQDQDHDFGNGYESPQRLRGERREHGGQADQHQGGYGVGDHAPRVRPVTARCGTPRHLPAVHATRGAPQDE
jgi:hypothetical protein